MKWLFLGLGGLSFAGGLITLPTPLPFGIPLMALGVALVYPYSRNVRVRLKLLARKSELASAVLDRIDRVHRPKTSDRSKESESPADRD